MTKRADRGMTGRFCSVAGWQRGGGEIGDADHVRRHKRNVVTAQDPHTAITGDHDVLERTTVAEFHSHTIDAHAELRPAGYLISDGRWQFVGYDQEGLTHDRSSARPRDQRHESASALARGGARIVA